MHDAPLPVHHDPPDETDETRPSIGSATPYTAPCSVCGRRVHLSEDELVASLSAPPVCWLCDG